MKNNFTLNSIRRWNFAFRVFGRDLTTNDYKKMVRYLFYKHILNKQLPISVVFAITYRCQCHCVHCSVGAYANFKKELNTEEVKNVLNNISKLGVFKVTFFGGEPLLREDILELIEFGRNAKLRISIDTNGLALTKNMVRQLKKLKISNVNISLDSANSVIHDRVRNMPGCFEAAVSGIKYCTEEKVPCLVSTYASKRAVNSGDLKELIKFSRMLGAWGVKILFPILSGNWINRTEEKLSVEEEEVVRNLLDPSFVYLEDAFSMARNASKRCSALDKNFFYISPMGDVQLCPAIPIVFGNIRNVELPTIVNKMWNHYLAIMECEGCLMNDVLFRSKYSFIWKEKGRIPIDIEEIEAIAY